MAKKPKSIPLNVMTDKFRAGIVFGRNYVPGVQTFDEAAQSHRDDYHLFLLLEEGFFNIEIDFEKYRVVSKSVAYVHPDQVHRIGAFEDATVSYWVVNNENLHDEQRKLLEDISPAMEKQTIL